MDVLRKFFFYRYEFLIKCLLYMFSVLFVLFIEKKVFLKIDEKNMIVRNGIFYNCVY